MTDNEIMEALPFLAKYCKDEYNDIRVDDVLLGAFDFINRLQADKDALIAGQETLQKALAEKTAEIERLQKLLEGWKTEAYKVADENDKVYCEAVERVRTAKSEAYKELAQKLKEQFNDLEFNVKTPLKTVKVEELRNQVNWILREVVIQTIDSVLNECVEVVK